MATKRSQPSQSPEHALVVIIYMSRFEHFHIKQIEIFLSLIYPFSAPHIRDKCVKDAIGIISASRMYLSTFVVMDNSITD
jgi:hypothetical protein